jgi:hypothetical protein
MTPFLTLSNTTKHTKDAKKERRVEEKKERLKEIRLFVKQWNAAQGQARRGRALSGVEADVMKELSRA